MSKLSEKLTREKPWAWFRVSRKKYESMRIWKDCGLTREQFDNLILALPQDIIEQIHEESMAEQLVKAIFKES